MSKLTKVVLINWMYFQKVTLPIEGNTAIVGVNGTGKSTIIDAIQMLLLGKKGSKFNSGANAEKRTLESYVRGHINSDNKEYLRQGDVISYLALEIEISGDKHIFGINIEYKLNQNKLSDPKYFYIKNCELNEELFVTDNNYPKSYDEFNKEIRKEHEFAPFQSLMSYQNKVKEIFGLKAENSYFKILSRAIGLKNITECDRFMNEFVLDDVTIDVSEIKNNILEMSRVSKTIDKEEEKIHALEDIVNRGNDIILDSKELENLELKSILSNKLLNEKQVNEYIRENQTFSLSVEEENNKKNALQTANFELNKTRNEYVKMSESINPDLPKKTSDLDQASKDYDETHVIYNTFVTRCKSELPNLVKFHKYKSAKFDQLYDYIKKEKYTTPTTKKLFVDFKEEARILEDSYKSKADKMLNDLNNSRNELERLKNTIAKLENNEHPFDLKYVEFKKYIKEGLRDQYHEDIEVKFLCEYLDITDESWRNAIEGYLGVQRFYLIVPNNYYKSALKLYYANKNLSGTRLINGLKLPNFDFEEHTLGSYIIASNDIALNYARYVLNRVHCVGNILDLDKFDISITKDCMCYQNYSSWRISQKLYRKTYIGLEGLKKQLEVVKDDYQKLNEDTFTLLNEYNDYLAHNEKMALAGKFSTEILEDSNFIPSIDKDSFLFDKINKLTEEINFYKSNPKYLDICVNIAKVEHEIKSNNELITKCVNNLIIFNASIKTNESKIEDKKSIIELLEGNLGQYDELSISNELANLENVRLSNGYVYNIEKEVKALEKKIIECKTRLEGLMREARDKFNINHEPCFDSLNEFKKEKNKINDSVFKYSSKLIEMQKSHRKLFFSEFLSKLNKSIEQAKETIKNLNSSLAVFTFGNDYYSIKVGITENQDLKTIYNYAKEFNSENSNRGLFVDREVEDKERQRVEELLNQYMFSEDVTTQAIVVDYRRYLYFDVEVHTKDGIKSLNKVIRSQSGGEVQVPFYILSGVAFKQTLDYKRNKDSLGIVLYDEAFDKMDSQRIQSMLQFYKDKLKLQVILAAPGKLDSLVDNIETILAVVRDGDNAIVSDVSHEI